MHYLMRVAVILESATDVHWMKDVVQFPNAIANLLGDTVASLVCKPNHKQHILAKHIDLYQIGEADKKNIDPINNSDYSNISYDPSWHLLATKKISEKAQVLILYPWFADFILCSKIFKKNAPNPKKKVILKSDGLLNSRAQKKPGLWQMIKDVIQFRYIDVVICENLEVYNCLLKTHVHLRKKLVYMPNCPHQIYADQKTTEYRQKSNTFLFVGRPQDPEKGIDILLNAWIKCAGNLPQWKLLIAGYASMEFKNSWTQKMSEHNLETTIEWKGDVSPDDLLTLYSTSKIVICTSRKESGPIVLSEAALSGCAFIGTKVGEIPAVLEGLEGVVADHTDLQNVMIRFALNPELASEQAQILQVRLADRNWKQQVAAKLGKIILHDN